MAYSESLALRIRHVVARRRGITEKKMFGGVVTLLNGNMLVGAWKDSLIVRLGPEQAAEALKESHVAEFNVTGRVSKNWVMVEPDGLESDEQLRNWIERATKFVGKLEKK